MIEYIKARRLRFMKKEITRGIVLSLLLMAPLLFHLFYYKPVKSLSPSERMAGNVAVLTMEACTDAYCTLSYTSQGIHYDYYLAIVENKESERPLLLTVEVDRDKSAIEKKIFESLSTGKTIKLYGVFADYGKGSELSDFYSDFLDELGFTTEQKEEISLPVFFSARGHFPYIKITLALIGLLTLTLTLANLIRTKNGHIYKSLSSSLQALDVTEEELLSDISNASSVATGGKILSGNRFTYINIFGTKPEIIDNKKIVKIRHKKANVCVMNGRFALLNILSAIICGVIFIPMRLLNSGSVYGSYMGTTATEIVYTIEGANKPKRVYVLASWLNIDVMYKSLKVTSPWIKTVYTE